jgi:hypothetical protein
MKKEVLFICVHNSARSQMAAAWPYWSSHLDGAESEKIVPSGHPAHRDPQAIAEMVRILKKHIAGEGSVERRFGIARRRDALRLTVRPCQPQLYILSN